MRLCLMGLVIGDVGMGPPPKTKEQKAAERAERLAAGEDPDLEFF